MLVDKSYRKQKEQEITENRGVIQAELGTWGLDPRVGRPSIGPSSNMHSSAGG